MKKSLALSMMFVFSLAIGAQIVEPIQWHFKLKPLQGDQTELTLHATIDKGWHLYNTNLPEGGPVSTSFHFEKVQGASLVGKPTTTSTLVRQYDNQFAMELSWFVKEALFVQKIKVTDPSSFRIEGYVEFMGCNDVSCLPPDKSPFEFDSKSLGLSESKASTKNDKVQSGQDVTNISSEPVSTTASTDSTTQEAASNPLINAWWTPVIDDLKAFAAEQGDAQHAHHASWWLLFLSGLLGGLLALLTPCVWPIIPMTVSFFLKRNQKRSKAIREALLYGLSIIGIYLTLGLGITAIFGASALNSLSTNAVFNLLFFALLVVFAISFFGAFEIVLPASWTTKMDQKADSTSGVLSIFFMAFTLALVSFSCTGPIIGTLLVEAATAGSLMGPAIGMFGFALALAIPFALFAIFPNLLQSMPKSGNWLKTVKVVLGFLELAFALKFFSVADLAYGWGLLSRDTFLILWIINFGLLGLYLLNESLPCPFRLRNKTTKAKRFGWITFVLGLVSIAFTGWMVPGLSGAPLSQISAFAPPATSANKALYSKQLHAQFNTYEEGMEYAKAQGKPVLIDFSGFGCVNCRKMENSVWQNEEVKRLLSEDFVLITLMVDDKTPLAQPIPILENGRKRTLSSIGDQWSYLQRYKFGANAQPFYVMLDGQGRLLGPSRAYDESVEAYVDYLENGLENYRKRR